VWVAVWERAAEHDHEVLGGEQGIDEAVEAGAQRWGRSFGLRSQMPGLGAGQLELALKIYEGHIDVSMVISGLTWPSNFIRTGKLMPKRSI
jgi:hypothetical protein